jgi:hypothetical protein
MFLLHHSFCIKMSVSYKGSGDAAELHEPPERGITE